MAPRSVAAAASLATITVAIVMATMAAALAPAVEGPSERAPIPTTTPQPTAVFLSTHVPTPTPLMEPMPMMMTTSTQSAAEPVGLPPIATATQGRETTLPMEPGQPYANPTPSATPMGSLPSPTGEEFASMLSTVRDGAPVTSAAPTAAPSPVDPSDPLGAGTPASLSFWVVNATSGLLLFPLTSSTNLEPAVLGLYSIAAVPSTTNVAGVTFTLPTKYAHTEKTAPYVLGWNTAGVTKPVFLTPGNHTVSAHVEMPDGSSGPSWSVTFTVSFPPVTDFWVVDADPTSPTNGQRLFRLHNKTVLDIAKVGQWSIEAEYGPGDGLSVRFTKPPQYAHLEQGKRPMMMAPTSPGVIWPARLPLGRHTIAAHTEDWRGERGPVKEVCFVLDDTASN
ncbi:hypothetical protein MMPV_005018 [Pyropia vietnamensis]